jgi:hypothetical protein
MADEDTRAMEQLATAEEKREAQRAIMEMKEMRKMLEMLAAMGKKLSAREEVLDLAVLGLVAADAASPEAEAMRQELAAIRAEVEAAEAKSEEVKLELMRRESPAVKSAAKT